MKRFGNAFRSAVERAPRSEILEVLAVALITYGVALIYFPAGFIVAGIGLAIIALGSDSE